MRVPIFQVDAFATQLYAGNPAAVMLLDNFPSDAVMQSIAAENNLAETAFLVGSGADYKLRWFTPAVEVPLCGHATLASSAVIMERLEPGRKRVVFHTASGALTVDKTASGYAMDFPARHFVPVVAPPVLSSILGTTPVEVLCDPLNYLAVLESAQRVRELAPDIAAIAGLDRGCVIVTAPGDQQYDFVSRYFAPAKGIAEDPVTGAAHCALAPYWARRLGNSAFRAFQASKRGGEVMCRLVGERVVLEGTCVFYMEGIADV
jgi:PhzF family phenazine biosynthesis protein